MGSLPLELTSDSWEFPGGQKKIEGDFYERKPIKTVKRTASQLQSKLKSCHQSSDDELP